MGHVAARSLEAVEVSRTMGEVLLIAGLCVLPREVPRASSTK